MHIYSKKDFENTVLRNYDSRRGSILHAKESLSASGELETKSLGHPYFEDLAVGECRAESMVMVFLDLTDFTGRSFWDAETEVVDLAHAVLSGFIETVSKFGGYPLGLRGDGLFAGFGPCKNGVPAALALVACAFALDAVENSLNPRLKERGIAPVQARAGLDYGRISFVRSGNEEHSEINPLGFAANFAAKCEKKAKSWEVVVGEGLTGLVPNDANFVEHNDSPKIYQRNYEKKAYKYYNYSWRKVLEHIPGIVEELNGSSSEMIAIF
ncbi:adenylate/guanylate cyclase domain-containing protein [Glutamicibacter protophormiae]|uniref:Class 3 adenylate cyclase n=1 Tax=Glutamicibacter protophormiae TaxID=37930 RepID=A0ABS4XVS9_GLUPR|nr:adenylate/guanylate cyclase domain-containing protein [Glutamicibacter protophormiae]MBP2399808.1 class 3 adenylate cyclase [Glutamicibacter protophormiae]GGL77482.1 hypothetical protein GCM10010038_04550 [Glutamicibacter protophormiae]